MGRVSRAEAARHREQVVETAARLFRKRGVRGVNLAELMAQVGLTHGGFYRQFTSKEALAAEAAESAFKDLTQSLVEIAGRHGGDRDSARQELVDTYLSTSHRDDAGNGCVASALGGDVGREDSDSPLRSVYTEGVHGITQHLADFSSDPESRQEQLGLLCTLVGGIILARATADDTISEEILAAARQGVSPAKH